MRTEAKNTSVVAVATAASASMTFMWLPNPQFLGCQLDGLRFFACKYRPLARAGFPKRL